MKINAIYDYIPKMYTYSDLVEGKVKLPTPSFQDLPDSFVKDVNNAYSKIQEENNKIFLEHIFNPSKKYIQDFLSLPDYGDFILPFLTEKKPAELAYLHKLATMKDKNQELRIPSVCFPFFSEISTERLKILEPIITSKNYLGGWNYSAGFINSLDRYSEPQLELMAKLAKCKINGFDMQQIATPPFIMHSDKILEKAETLNKYYGKNLLETGLYADNDKLYVYGKVNLSDSKGVDNYKDVYVNIDYEPKNNKTSGSFDSIVDTMAKNIETKLSIFTEDDLNKIGRSIQREMPNVRAEEILLTMQKLTQFANYSSLKNIGEELQKLNIGKFTAVGDINPIFNYFCNSKKLCPLSNDIDANYAFFITRNDLNNKKEMAFLKQWLKRGEMKNIKFINLEGWSDGVNLLSDDKGLEQKVKRVITKAKKLTEKDKYITFREAVNRVLNNHIVSTMKNIGADVITINVDSPATKTVILDQMRPNYPSSSIIKSTIQAIAGNYTTDEKVQKGLSERLARYFDANLDVYSKQSIINNLKIIHSKIDKYLQDNNLSYENVYLITPPNNLTRKSFELITKMYSELWNIPEEKIVQVKDICALNTFPKNSTFVVLDDIIGTGKSMANLGEYLFYGKNLDSDKHILFAPISGTDFGISHLRDVISSIGRSKNDKVIYIDTNIKQPSNLKSVFKNLYYKINNSSKHIYGAEGYDNSSQCIAFPYMTPDNNTVIANDIMKYFVADYNCIKNPNADMLKIEKDAYRTNLFGSVK